MPDDLRSSRRPAGIVVGIGRRGLDTYRAAVRLGAEEATLRQVPLRLVHGSRLAGQDGPGSASGMEFRQQRGRRLVNGAARDLARTSLGRQLDIWTESSPRTGKDLLLAHGRTAVMLVLQRGDGWLPTTSTTIAVTAAAWCPTLVTRFGDRSADGGVVLVVLDLKQDPAPGITVAFMEASLRRIMVTVLHGPGDAAACRVAIRAAGARNPSVVVHQEEIGPAQTAERIRSASAGAVLMVVVRPALGGPPGLVEGAVDEATCPVLMVAPGHDGA